MFTVAVTVAVLLMLLLLLFLQVSIVKPKRHRRCNVKQVGQDFDGENEVLDAAVEQAKRERLQIHAATCIQRS